MDENTIYCSRGRGRSIGIDLREDPKYRVTKSVPCYNGQHEGCGGSGCDCECKHEKAQAD